MAKELIPKEIIEKKILLIRGHKVMLDRDLAELYGVSTKVLNQAVKRNIKRFNPFAFFVQNIPDEVHIDIFPLHNIPPKDIAFVPMLLGHLSGKYAAPYGGRYRRLPEHKLLTFANGAKSLEILQPTQVWS